MMTLICGLPRAGKTTYSKQFEDVIHLDNSGSYRGVLRIIKNRRGNVIVEGVYRLHEQRKSLIKTYKGNERICIWLNTPDEIRQTRDGWDKYCDIPPFEPPTLEEGWDEIIIIRGEYEQRINRQRKD